MRFGRNQPEPNNLRKTENSRRKFWERKINPKKIAPLRAGWEAWNTGGAAHAPSVHRRGGTTRKNMLERTEKKMQEVSYLTKDGAVAPS